MSALRDFWNLTIMGLLMNRDAFWILLVIQVAFTVGLVIGFGYFIPEMTETTALYLTTGAATQSIITVSLVSAPQVIAQAKAEGRLDYLRTLPISREAYVLSNVAVVLFQALPGIFLAFALGSWKYDLDLTWNPVILPVILLATLSLAGVGCAMAILIPHQQITNAITQLTIFYVVFFAPVIIPASQLPEFLQTLAKWLPPTYAADAVRAALTDLPNEGLARDMAIMAGFAIVSIAASSIAIRRRD